MPRGIRVDIHDGLHVRDAHQLRGAPAVLIGSHFDEGLGHPTPSVAGRPHGGAEAVRASFGNEADDPRGQYRDLDEAVSDVLLMCHVATQPEGTSGGGCNALLAAFDQGVVVASLGCGVWGVCGGVGFGVWCVAERRRGRGPGMRGEREHWQETKAVLSA